MEAGNTLQRLPVMICPEADSMEHPGLKGRLWDCFGCTLCGFSSRESGISYLDLGLCRFWRVRSRAA